MYEQDCTFKRSTSLKYKSKYRIDEKCLSNQKSNYKIVIKYILLIDLNYFLQ